MCYNTIQRGEPMKEQSLRLIIFSAYLEKITSKSSIEIVNEPSMFKIYSDRMTSHGDLLDFLLLSYQDFFPIKKFKKSEMGLDQMRYLASKGEIVCRVGIMKMSHTIYRYMIIHMPEIIRLTAEQQESFSSFPIEEYDLIEMSVISPKGKEMKRYLTKQEVLAYLNKEKPKVKHLTPLSK